MKKNALKLVVMVSAFLLLTACAPAAAQPTFEAVEFEQEVLIAEGRLLPLEALEQSFSIPGQVAEVLVADGEAVNAGQVLARLHASPEAQSALTRAEQERLAAQQALDELNKAAGMNLPQARLARFEAQKQREMAQEQFDSEATLENKAALDASAAVLKQAEEDLVRLLKGDGVDPDQLASVKARLAAAEAAVTSAKAALDAQSLKAAVDGTVVDLALQVGQRVPAGQPVLTLADFSTWLIKTDNLTELDVVNVQEGQQVEVVLDALPAVTLVGEVTHINARYEEKRGDITYTVTVALKQTDPRMRWGMTAAVALVP